MPCARPFSNAATLFTSSIRFVFIIHIVLAYIDIIKVQILSNFGQNDGYSRILSTTIY